LIYLGLAIIGSAINLPLTTIQGLPPEQVPHPPLPPWMRWRFRQIPYRGFTLIALNVGGAVLPTVMALAILTSGRIDLLDALLGTAVVTALSKWLSRPLPGVGIAMPILAAPLAAALTALAIAPEAAPALAFVSGTFGVLIGADLLNWRAIPKMGAPVASIGGAGTFDGIFMTGIVAVLLA